ncbi:MAG: hypothetical protein H6Q16_2121 [Bacteroidetes bacterium]|nr:hypothetical protein [Bacteroidota bacterium]
MKKALLTLFISLLINYSFCQNGDKYKPINQFTFDSLKNKQGLWVEDTYIKIFVLKKNIHLIYFDGNAKEKGYYKDNKKEGMWTVYRLINDNKNIDLNSVLANRIYKNDTLLFEIQYIKNKICSIISTCFNDDKKNITSTMFDNLFCVQWFDIRGKWINSFEKQNNILSKENWGHNSTSVGIYYKKNDEVRLYYPYSNKESVENCEEDYVELGMYMNKKKEGIWSVFSYDKNKTINYKDIFINRLYHQDSLLYEIHYIKKTPASIIKWERFSFPNISNILWFETYTDALWFDRKGKLRSRENINPYGYPNREYFD